MEAHGKAEDLTFERPPLKAGQRLGPYEIVSTLGRGGMGEVYHARDTRLRRDVALKTIRSAFARDPERLRRFEQEALTTAQLNHANIATVFDVGSAEGITYVVSELVGGKTLRAILDGGPLPLRAGIEYGMQIAHGLAAAHEKGIIHRDLKPDNILATDDGVVKIVDFGLAKLITRAEEDEATAVLETSPGMVMGTAGYMAPEQARGMRTDHRADIFSFGAVAYEMFGGRRAFEGATTADTISAVLTAEPAGLASIPANVDRIIRHCLEKNRERRFQSASDIAFALEALLTASGQQIAVAADRRRRVPWAILSLAAVSGIAISAATYLAVVHGPSAPLSYQQLTFRRGTIRNARFSPDGNTIVYDAAWDGKTPEILVTRPDGTESRPLGVEDAELLAISSSGEIAVLLHPHTGVSWAHAGMLARVPLAGGTPREVLENVFDADWSPSGSMAIIRDVEARSRLEYPIGHVLYSTAGWLTNLRFSPSGDFIAFLEHPVRPDDGGMLRVSDLHGNVRVLSTGWRSVRGLTWSPDGDALYLSGERTTASAIYRISLRATERLVAAAPSGMRWLDISLSRRALVSEDQWRNSLFATTRASKELRDLSWLDWSGLKDLSADGRVILFDESSIGGGPRYSVYVRRIDGSPAVRIGEGVASAISPDLRWAITFQPNDNPAALVIVPTGAGEGRQISTPGLNHQWACWFPDGRRILFAGIEKGREQRLYVQDLAGGSPHAITEDGVRISYGNSISADGKWVMAIDNHRRLAVYSTAKPSAGFEIPNTGQLLRFANWAADSRFFYASSFENGTLMVDRIEVATGKPERWFEIRITERAGIVGPGTVKITPDGNTIVWSQSQKLSTLHLASRLP